MKQVIRKGIKDIIVDEVPDPVVTPHHVLVRPLYSLISSGTETASIHQEGVLKEVGENPSHLRKVWDVMKDNGPVRTIAEVQAKFSEYAVLGYSGAGVVVDKHPTVAGHGDRRPRRLRRRRHRARRDDPGGAQPRGESARRVPFEHACFATLGSIALNAVRTADVGLGDVVAVIGLGLVGQLVAQLARLQGAVVHRDRSQARARGACRQLGADHVVARRRALR